jgi:glycosyltransferase involved in cell wall biosynthesis
MRAALVHDWLTGMRGGEKVLLEHARLLPDADIHTLVHVPGSTHPEIETHRVQVSPLSRLPGIERHYRKLLPLFPWAIGQLEVGDVDFVLSSTHAVAKGIPTPHGAVHLAYCFTPMRYVWDQADAYLGTGVFRAAATPLVAALRRWDVRTSDPDRVQRVIAISTTVADRIERHWGRRADVIFPPVDVERFSAGERAPEDFYLMVGGFVPYKREDLAIEAFRTLGLPLVVAGDGPSRRRIEAEAPANVRFVGRVDDAALDDLYARCRALVYPQEEDFGIIPVEAQAAGAPVIAFGRGGVTDTIVPHGIGNGSAPTGVFFEEPDTEALIEAVRRFDAHEGEFEAPRIRSHAAGFDAARFRSEMRAAIDETLANGPQPWDR